MDNFEMLNKIWDRQKSFNKNFEHLFPDKESWTKEMVLHLMSESDELLREINWKIHRKENTVIIRSNLIEEWIDVFKYWLTIGQIWGFSPADFVEEFNRKSSVVEQRFKQEQEYKTLDDKKVCAFDIDGVLAKYPEDFLEFANEKYNMNWELKDVPDCFNKPNELYTKIKDDYRQSGRKRWLSVIDNAKETLETLKAKGYTIILLTARPYKKYKRIYADTIAWLKENELPYDMIIWDEDKISRIIKEFPNVEFMVEDHLPNVKKISALGYKVYWLKPSYIEMPDTLPSGAVLIKSLLDIKEVRQ